jgi:maltose-binding protein MalE
MYQKKHIEIIIGIIFFIGIFIVAFLWLQNLSEKKQANTSNLEKQEVTIKNENQNQNETTINDATEKNISGQKQYACSADIDCSVTNFNDKACCPGPLAYAISIAGLKAQDSWRINNCNYKSDNNSPCPNVRAYEKVSEPFCEQGVCKIR